MRRALPRQRRAIAPIGQHFAAVSNRGRGRSVKFHILFATAVAATLALPLAAQAQGIPDGIAHGGGAVGMNTAGPIGAVVGGAVGGVVGGVEGLFGLGPTYAAYPEDAPRAYPHHHWVRHTYHHVHRRPAAS